MAIHNQRLLSTARLLVLAFFLGLVCPIAVLADPLSGRVTDDKGEPLTGAMVTVSAINASQTVTRYTGPQGQFSFQEVDYPEFKVRVRLSGYSDKSLLHDDLSGGTGLNIRMTKAGRQELLSTLPANVWAERVKIKDPTHNQRFRIHCMGCHQQGNPTTRWPKDKEQWMSVFDRMAHKSALVTQESRDVIATALLEAYQLKPDEVPTIPTPPVGAALRAKISEWRLLTSESWLHDSKVGNDGAVYSTDSTMGRLVRFDPATNAQTILEFEEYDPEFKNFVGTSTQSYPHGLGVGPEGNVWTLLALDQSVAKYDVKERKIVKRYKLPYGSIFPHTARFDPQGRLWFSLALSNQLAMFDSTTEEFEVIDLPTRTFNQWLAAKTAPMVLWVITKFKFKTTPDPEAMPLPYGVDVAPDGKVWVSQWNNATIVSYDPKTGELDSYDTPFYGPRRIAVDSKGIVWIPAWGESRIYSFDPATQVYEGFDLPTGPGSAAYTVDVHPQDDSIWVCGANSDSMMRFDPQTESFIVYPMPTRVTFCRDIDFDSAGNVWSNYSNFPSSHMEGGGIPGLVKIEPNL